MQQNDSLADGQAPPPLHISKSLAVLGMRTQTTLALPPLPALRDKPLLPALPPTQALGNRALPAAPPTIQAPATPRSRTAAALGDAGLRTPGGSVRGDVLPHAPEGGVAAAGSPGGP